MAENLFSKYRPLTLDGVFGHEKVKKELAQRIKENNLPKAILLTGKSGTGKNCFEKIISKALLCSDNKGSPCNVCDQCQTVINERISNYYSLNNASNLGIDDMRIIEELASRKNLSTTKHKVIVIDELQEMAGSNPKALKNLLKVLERPMNGVTFLLIAMDETKIPPALKNRCVHYRLKDLTFEEIAKHLYEICTKEGIEIDTEDKANTLVTVANNSDGSMRTAISYLERCIYSELWNPKTVLDELGIISNDGLITIINQLLSGDVKLFDNEITKDILDKIRWILNLLYKSKNGVTLNSWQKTYIQGILNFSLDNIGNTIDSLNKITLFPYINQEIIDFTLIDILRKNKGKEKLVEEIKTQPEVKTRERKRVDQ